MLGLLVKLLVARPWNSGGEVVAAVGRAFPSGYTTVGTAGWLAVALVLGWLSRSFARSVVLLAAGVVTVVLVGVSRVYSGGNCATDVLGGWALGGLWLAAVLVAVHLVTTAGGPAASS